MVRRRWDSFTCCLHEPANGYVRVNVTANIESRPGTSIYRKVARAMNKETDKTR